MSESTKSHDEKKQKKLLQSGEIPNHIAIIMDGNGRWAKQKGFPRIAGHKTGVESVKDIVEAAAQIGVKHLTLYTFSTENWKRPKTEVFTLMRLIVKTLSKEINRLNKENIRIFTIGDFSMLPTSVQQEFVEAMEKTKNNTKMQLTIALSYGSRWEILEAVKKMMAEFDKGLITLDDITNEKFSDYLTTKGIPDPELVIRTSGEFRVSNFLLWQIAYSEFYVTDTFWPDFRRDNLYEAIKNFQTRERRFGKVSEQVSHK
ncbi:MAG: isoprenyl transferase [Ignavibacteriales bacterium]|nr:isoprenyl transferase [Ignavibacteriales bacterium]